MSESKGTMVQGCVLSDKDIITELDKTVIIKPFNESQIGPNSYDTTLGHFYYERNEGNLPGFYNPLNGKHVAEFWGVTSCAKANYGAKKASVVRHEYEAQIYGLNVGDEFILIPSGHMILAHTNEFIGSRINVTTMMKSRSTIGRGGLTICSCAGSGDVGFFNRYTYEIHNRNPVTVVLKVGDRIGQILFMRTGEVSTSYEKRGQYQTTDNIEELMANWKPLCMIPKCGVDYASTYKVKDISAVKDSIIIFFIIFFIILIWTVALYIKDIKF